MALPKKLKHLNLFNDGNSYLGVAKSVTPPKLARKMERPRLCDLRNVYDRDEVLAAGFETYVGVGR